MAEQYYVCSKCSKVTRSLDASITEVAASEGVFDDNEGASLVAARVLLGITDVANLLTRGFLFKGIGIAIGAHPYKCTECGHVRMVGPDGKETIG
jgi:DNA-directed RNA polymerase subunit RPC12/RpoP